MSGRGFRPTPAQRAAMDKRRLHQRGSDDDEASRLIGRCDLCGQYHAFPDVRQTCSRCLETVCYRPCQCWRRCCEEPEASSRSSSPTKTWWSWPPSCACCSSACGAQPIVGGAWRTSPGNSRSCSCPATTSTWTTPWPCWQTGAASSATRLRASVHPGGELREAPESTRR